MSVVVYTNGINCLPHLNTEYNRNKIVFVGNMRTLQNQDAVRFFVRDIFPLIKQSVPGAFFCVIGAEPPPFIQIQCAVIQGRDTPGVVLNNFSSE